MPSSPWSSTGSGASTTPAATTALVNPHLTDPDWLCVPAKAQVITNYNAELQVQTQLQAGAAACSPAVSTSAYDTAVAGLTTYLNGLTNNPSGNPAWSSSAGDTYLGAGGGATLQAKWAAVAQQRTILGTSIGQAQATKASNDAISAAAADASTKVNNALTQAANDATAKAAAQKQAAIDAINASVGGVVPGATSASDAVSRLLTLANSAQSTANAAQTMPTYASPAALPAASGFAPGYGPVLTLSDYVLWRVNASADGWDRILFAADGIFGKITADQADVGSFQAAVASIPYLKSTLINVIADATATGPGGTTQIGGLGIRTRSIAASNMIVGGAGPALNADPLCQDPGSWSGGSVMPADGRSMLFMGGSKCLTSTEIIPLDITKAYRVSLYVCASNTTGPFYAGLNLLDGSGSHIGGGAYHYIAAAGVVPSQYWEKYAGTIGPAGSGADIVFPSNTVKAQLLALCDWRGSDAGQTYIRDFRLEEMVPGELLVDGGIRTKNLSATCASTANFTQGTDDVNGGSYAAAGAAMVVNTPNTPALITDAAGLKIGKRVFTDYWFRLLNAIDGSYSGGILVWRGNNDTTVRNGASNIDCLDLVISNVGDNALLRWRLKPTSLTDNLDGMHQLRAQVFPGVGGATPGLTIYPELRDRYYVTANHGDAANEVIGDAFYGQLFKVLGTGYWYNGFVGHLLVDISNSYGWSAQRWFHSTSSGWYTRDSTAPTGAPAAGGSSAGGSRGGGCPAPWVPVLLASGLEVQAGSLRDGMTVVGVDDCTGAPSVGVLRGVERRWVRRVRVVLEDGRAPEFTATHRLGTVEGGWCEAQHLAPGQLLAAQRESRVRAVEAAGQGQVVSFEVEGCHTYFAGGLLSHNYKAGKL